MEDRPLTATVEPHLVSGRVHEPDEGGDEPIVRQDIGELVVDLHECGFEVGTEPKSHSEHRVHLRNRKRGGDAMAGCVGQNGEQSLIEDRQVEGISTGKVCGFEGAIHIVACEQRHGGRQRAHLHHAGGLQFLTHLLAFDEVLGHAHALQRDRALRCQHGSECLVVLVEDAIHLVQYLHHADQDVLVVHQRKRQHAAGSITGTLVHFRIEALVCVAVGYVDDPAVARTGAGQTDARRYTNRGEAGGNLDHQLVRRGVIQPHRPAVGAEDLFGCAHHFGQHSLQVKRGRQLARDREDRLHVRHGKAALFWPCAHAVLRDQFSASTPAALIMRVFFHVLLPESIEFLGRCSNGVDALLTELGAHLWRGDGGSHRFLQFCNGRRGRRGGYERADQIAVIEAGPSHDFFYRWDVRGVGGTTWAAYRECAQLSGFYVSHDRCKAEKREGNAASEEIDRRGPTAFASSVTAARSASG